MHECARIFLVLLWKEWKLFRAHIALQLVLLLLVVLGLLVVFGTVEKQVYLSVLIEEGADEPFARYLMMTEPDVRFQRKTRYGSPGHIDAEVWIPKDLEHASEGGKVEVRAVYDSANPIAGLAVRQILRQRLLEYLGVPLPVELNVRNSQGEPLAIDIPSPPPRKLTDAKTTREITMILICTMTLMIVGLNFFSILFSEEKASRVLLPQLLSPASFPLLFLSKYVMSLFLVAAILCIILIPYRATALLNPLFWGVILAGTITYMCIALPFILRARAQSTANVVSLAYAFVISIVFFLARDITFFAHIEKALPEYYIFEFIGFSLTGETPAGSDVPVFAAVSAIICFCSLLFARIRGIRWT